MTSQGIESFLDQMGILEAEDRVILGDALLSAQGELDQILEEALSNDDKALVQEIYVRIDRLIKGSVLVSFLELRRQHKATQRELAELRKRLDQENRKNESFRQFVEASLKKIQEDLGELTKALGDSKKDRQLNAEKTRKSLDTIDQIAKDVRELKNNR